MLDAAWWVHMVDALLRAAGIALGVWIGWGLNDRSKRKDRLADARAEWAGAFEETLAATRLLASTAHIDHATDAYRDGLAHAGEHVKNRRAVEQLHAAAQHRLLVVAVKLELLSPAERPFVKTLTEKASHLQWAKGRLAEVDADIHALRAEFRGALRLQPTSAPALPAEAAPNVE